MEFEVSSTHPSQIDVYYSRHKYQQMQIAIDNEDNAPLALGSLHVFQLKRYLIIWLAAKEEYVLKIGKKNLPAPNYDLRFFADSIPGQMPSLALGEVLLDKKQVEAGRTIFNSKNFIWSAIVIVALLLGYMAVKMAKDVGKPEN